MLISRRAFTGGALGAAVALQLAPFVADDALREQGLEVWFDRNELRGGDAWDASIRRQIRECALFVPIISASTNARSRTPRGSTSNSSGNTR